MVLKASWGEKPTKLNKSCSAPRGSPGNRGVPGIPGKDLEALVRLGQRSRHSWGVAAVGGPCT